MTDREAITDELVCQRAQAKEREYTVGWRAFRDGLPCPSGHLAKLGYLEAQSAADVHGRDILWSAKVPDTSWMPDETCSWRRPETDRDRSPA
jgi:hypothetical protein